MATSIAYKGDYQVYLNLKPWIPMNNVNDPSSSNVDKAFKKFLSEHSGSDLRKALKHTYNAIDYIPFSLFYLRLKDVISSMNKIMSPEPYALLVEPETSTQWVAELAYHYLQHPPSYVINIRYFNEFIHEHNHIRNVVLLDDFSSSGYKLRWYLEDRIYFSYNLLKPEPFKVIIALPYATQRTESVLNKVFKTEVVGKSYLCIGEKIHSASEKIQHQQYEEILTHAYMNNPDYKKIWFALWMVGGLNGEKICFDASFLEMLVKFGLKNGNLICKFAQHIDSDSALDEALLETTFNNPGLRLLADLIYREVEQFVIYFRLTVRLWYSEIKPEQELKIIALSSQWRILDSDDGLRSRSLAVFDHRIHDRSTILEPFSNGVIRNEKGELECEGSETHKAHSIFSNSQQFQTKKDHLRRVHTYEPCEVAQLLVQKSSEYGTVS